jgi:hypothetical protein
MATPRKRLPNGAKEHMKSADQMIQYARQLAREIRADLRNPDERDMALEKLADLEIHLADARTFVTRAIYGAHDDEADL